MNYLFCSSMFIFEDVVLDTKNTALIKQINCSHFSSVRKAINKKMNIPEQNAKKMKA